MKKIIILLLINLLIPIYGFSENIYPKKLNDSLVIITADQLKLTNLKFLELEKLSKENIQLNNKIVLMDSLIVNQNKIDSININNINKLESLNTDLQNQLNKQNKLFKLKNFLGGTVIGVTLGVLITLIIK